MIDASPPTERRGAGGWIPWIVLPIVAAAIAAAYLPALRGDFIWDDDLYVSENPLLWEPEGLLRIWVPTKFASQYFPLTITVFRWAYQLWGLDVLGYHLLNVFVHSVNVVLVWTLLRALAVPGAILAAAIFAFHPVQVESVAWITELKNLLSTTFYLLAILAYLRFEDATEQPSGARVPGYAWYAVALGLFVLGLASKTVVCTLPAALLVLRWWRRKPIRVRDVVLLAPYFLIGLGSGLFVAWYETSHIGTTGAEFHFSLGERFLIAGRALWFYLGKLLFPVNLAFSYPRFQLDTGDPSQWAFVVGAVASGVVLWLAAPVLGRGPAAGLGFFVVAVSPMLGFVNYYTMRYSFVADHYQYLACLGPIAVASGWLARASERRRGVYAIGGATIVVVLASLTWNKAHAYKDREALWRDTVANNPASWMGHNNLGGVLLDADLVEEAVVHLETAKRLNPEYADPYSNLGDVLVRKGRFDEAIELFERAMELEPGNADFVYNLGTAFLTADRSDDAVRTFEFALQIDPDHAPTHNNLGIILSSRGRHEEAVAHFRAAVDRRPRDATFRYNLGEALLDIGDAASAAAEFRVGLEHAPGDTALRIGHAVALAELGRRDEAIDEYERVLASEPDNARAHYNLAVELVRARRLEEAVGHYRVVRELTPEDADAANNLGVILVSLDRAGEAIEPLEFAVESAPEDSSFRQNLATALERAGRADQALRVLEEGTKRAPDTPALLNALAWTRATSDDSRLRDGAEAVRLAERACELTDGRNPSYVDTLAAAYAEAGRFEEAVAAAKRAIELTDGSSPLSEELRQRLESYESGRPFRIGSFSGQP